MQGHLLTRVIYVCGGFMTGNMDTTFFLRVWEIYQDHWGRQEQLLIRSIVSADLLHSRFRSSSKMRGLLYMHSILKIMWGMELFIHKDEVFQCVRDMSDTCMGEDYEESMRKIDPIARMRDNIHLPCKQVCLDIYHREWLHVRGRNPHSHNIFKTFTTDDSIYRVSALTVLPNHL